MGEISFKAPRERGLPRVPATWLLACFLAVGSTATHSQELAASCLPVIARIVSLQGTVEVQRAGTANWLGVRRLDTSICAGDRLRTAPSSRAALFVQPETLVRVDQNTTITLQHSTDEIAVEFSTDEVSQVARNEQSCGAGYFITRFPKRFRVTTPHLNAAVEGTEFMVESSCEATRLTVLEGKVSSDSVTTRQRQLVAAGQSVQSGMGDAGAISTVVKPLDAVSWVLHYPRLSEAGASAHAEELLGRGRVGEALADVEAAIRANPSDAEALALRSVIQIAKNDKLAALTSADAAIASNPASHRAWLARSYAQQASFAMYDALESARKAQSLKADSSLVHARVAELLLSIGDFRGARQSAVAAIDADPRQGYAHAIFGFVELAEIATDNAQAEFAAAIDLDSFSALPRLGLGLAMIRQGNLIAGREQLEIAVALDPANSLLRSYVGKAYYEENSKERDTLAAEQFALSKQLDPMDPTPHFYNAILKYSQSQPSVALAEVEVSGALNDNRAVYRSRELLDQDLAARTISQATIYNELGLRQLGLTEAARSLAMDPGSGSAHRFLSDIYATKPLHGISRASELLQAQLRQPLGAQALQSQLANDVLFKSAFFGPPMVGLNEFNSLFLRDDLQFQVFGLLGNNGTYGDQAIVSGLHGPVSFSLGQLATETDGFRLNNDESIRQYNGFLQAQFGSSTSAQVELTSLDREYGDLTSSFDPSFFSDDARNDVDTETFRAGLRHVIDARSDLSFSAILRNLESRLDEPDPVFPFTFLNDEETWKAEAQYQRSGDHVNLTLGAGYFEGEGTLDIVNPFFPFTLESRPSHANAFGYLQFAGDGRMPRVQVGLSYDNLSTTEFGRQSEFNPKFGMIWSPWESLTVRAAAFRVLKRAVGSDQGLEPTQLAGFNQFFDDPDGTESEGFGLAADFRPSDELAAGVQLADRNLKSPFMVGDEVFFESQSDDTVSAYLYWLPSNQLSIAFEPRYQDFENGSTFDQMQLTEIPVSVRYFAASGWRLGVTATAVEQKGEFDGPGGVVEPGSDSFWLLDAILAYRLPRRLGTISLEGTNLLDERFRFQEIDLTVTPRYVPEAQYRLRVSLSF